MEAPTRGTAYGAAPDEYLEPLALIAGPWS